MAGRFRLRKIISICAILICVFIFLKILYQSHYFRSVRRKVVRKTSFRNLPNLSQESVNKNLSISILHDINLCGDRSKTSFLDVPTTQHGIPFIIHQIYKDTNLPTQYMPLVRGCRRVNKDFVHVLWTDDSGTKFVKKYFPHLVELQKKYKGGCDKADFLRLLLLYHYGGVYIDLDVECIKPLSESLDQFSGGSILDREREMQTRLAWNKNYTAMNSAMMSRPRHPFFKYLIDHLPEGLKHAHIMWRTGPFYVTRHFETYMKIPRSIEDNVVLAPASAFTPLIDPVLKPKFTVQCKTTKLSPVQRLGCEEWRKQGERQDEHGEAVQKAILVHRYYHLAYGYIKINQWTNVCKEVDDIHLWKD